MRKSFYALQVLGLLSIVSCQEELPTAIAPVLEVTSMTAEDAVRLSTDIRSKVAAEVHPSFDLTLWASDSLLADPIALDMDEQGRVYVTKTNRNGTSEFDIRGHRDWEINSIALQTVEERRAFLKLELSPDSSEVNDWFLDMNGDGSRDWKDLAVETEQVFRLEDTNRDGVADRSQLFADGFNDVVTDCNGALEIFDDNVFMGVGPDMWRLKDTDGDGYAEERTSISHGYNVHIGFGGHGMSGAEMGPDGRLYWGIGDVGFNGTGPDGKEWKYPNQGVIVRSELDGSNFEVFARGLRNTHEFVFDKYANIISEDNDGDHAGESERLVYIVEGSDTGWRINWQFGKYNDPRNNDYKVWMDEKLNVPRWDGQAAYITPCIRNYVNGPTGMLYNPGTALSPEWKDHFFLVEFVGNPSRSGIHAFTLKPAGATFDFDQDQKVIGGILPTGIDWGPDGALYAGDWIEGWSVKEYGRVWKLEDPKGKDWDERLSTQELITADYKAMSDDVLYGHLFHPDMRIRQKAQFEIVKRGDAGYAQLEKAAAQSEHQLARVHGIIGMAQMARVVDRKYAKGIVSYITDADAEIRAQAAKWIGDVRHQPAADQLIPLLKDESSRVRFFAAEALGRMEYAPAKEELVQMLLENDDMDAYLRHVGSLALSRIGDAQLLKSFESHQSNALRLAAVIALRRMQHKNISAYLDDEDILIVRDAARAINDDWSIEESLDDLGAILNSTPFYEDEPIIRRSINANLRVGSKEAVERVVAYARNDKNPKSLRVEAIETLSVWSDPSVLDRVDGRYRGPVKRSNNEIAAALNGILPMFGDKSTTIQKAVAVMASNNKMAEATNSLKSMLTNGKSTSVRKVAIESLIKLRPEGLPALLTTALGDSKQAVRVAALQGTMGTDITDDVKMDLLRSVIFNQTISERQAAIAALSSLPVAATIDTYKELLKEWSSGTLSPEVKLDLAESIETVDDQDLVASLHELQQLGGDDDVFAAYRDCLTGGDASRGSDILWRHTGAQCIRCHEVQDYGGIVGPSLNGIASLLNKEELLTSLILPNERIAPGYGMVSLIMNDDSEIDGMLIAEDTDQLKIRDANNEVIDVAVANVSDRIDAVSGMPDMSKLLTKKEIRDLLAYLVELKAEDSD